MCCWVDRRLWAVIENGQAEGMLSAHAIATIHYLIQKEVGKAKAKRSIKAILRVFRVAAVHEQAIAQALDSSNPDFEDAVTSAAAKFAICDEIVTCDPKSEGVAQC